MIGPVSRAADRSAIAALYNRNHPGMRDDLTPNVRHESQTFIMRDNGESQTLGVAIVSYFNCGVAPYGIIHQLEIARECSDSRRQVHESLIGACERWLYDRGAVLLQPPTGKLEFYIDTADGGKIKPEVEITTKRGTLPRTVYPRPLQAARRVTN